MAKKDCGCGGSVKTGLPYIWTSADGQSTIEYPSKIVAKAKVMRSGGTYAPKG